MTDRDKRRYPRFTSDLPVDFRFEEVVASESLYLNDISGGGLSFNSLVPLEPGASIKIRMPVNKPVLEMTGRVVWCRQMTFQYVVGVEFMSTDESFRRSMVQLVRHIETYKQDVLAREGRRITGQLAALEWMERRARGT